MSYDHQKVQAWLAQVSTDDPSALHLWLACLDAHHVRFHEGTKLWQLLNEFRLSSTWERTNMLYGLKDIADQVMAYDNHCYAQSARREDDAATSITFSVVAEDDPRYVPRMTLLAPVTPEVCSVCHQPFVHHQHPMKPLGVIISSTCGCNPTTEQADGQGHGPGEADR